MAVCAQFRRPLAGWSDLPSELRRLEETEGIRLTGKRFSQLPEWCLFEEFWCCLEQFDGLSGFSATHDLPDIDQRQKALDAIDVLQNKVNYAFVLERHALQFDTSELKRADDVVLYAGWKHDPEVDYRGFFVEVRIGCVPRSKPGRYYERFWREVAEKLDYGRDLVVEASDDAWMVLSNGKPKIKCTVGGGKGENPKGLAIYDDRDMAEVRLIFDRLSFIGDPLKRTFSCSLVGDHYDRFRATFGSLPGAWKVRPSCELSNEDKDSIRQGSEPAFTRLPGATFVWKGDNNATIAEFSCGFRKIRGVWHSVIGALANSQEIERQLTCFLATLDYERLN